MRNKVKKLVAECKRVALTVNSADGIQRIEDKYGTWFNDLYPIVKQRDSCDGICLYPIVKQRESCDGICLYPIVKQRDSCGATQVCEPSEFSKRLEMQRETEIQDERSPPIASPSSHLTADNVEGTIAQTRGKRTFVPTKDANKRRKIDSEMKETMQALIQENDKTNMLIKFMQEENEKSHEQIRFCQMLVGHIQISIFRQTFPVVQV